MAQSATDNLTLGTAHKKLTTKIAEINTFLQRHAMVGSLDTILQTEAGDLRKQLRHRLGYLKILWHAEPNVAKFEELQEWITGVDDEVRQKIHVLTVFMRARGARLTEHDKDGRSATDHPAGVAVVLPETEAATNAQTGLNIDTVEMREAQTPGANDTEGPQLQLRPKDASDLLATPTGQFNQRFNHPVDHLGGAKRVTKQQEQKLRTPTRKHQIPRLMDIRVTRTSVVGGNRQLASCWPPMGTCDDIVGVFPI